MFYKSWTRIHNRKLSFLGQNKWFWPKKVETLQHLETHIYILWLVDHLYRYIFKSKIFCLACVCQNRHVVQRHQPPVYANWLECISQKTKKECALWLHKILEEFYIFYHERSFLGPSKNDWQIFYSFGNLCVVRWYEKQKDRRLKQMRQRIIFEIWDRPHVQYDQQRPPLT